MSSKEPFSFPWIVCSFIFFLPFSCSTHFYHTLLLPIPSKQTHTHSHTQKHSHKISAPLFSLLYPPLIQSQSHLPTHRHAHDNSVLAPTAASSFTAFSASSLDISANKREGSVVTYAFDFRERKRKRKKELVKHFTASLSPLVCVCVYASKCVCVRPPAPSSLPASVRG